MNMAIKPEPDAPQDDGGGRQSAMSAQFGDAFSETHSAKFGLSPWRSLKSSFLIITLPSVLVILIAFFTYLEISQYRAATDQINEKFSRVLDSGSILLADATAGRKNDELLLLLAPVLADPDVVSVAVDLSDGSRLDPYG